MAKNLIRYGFNYNGVIRMFQTWCTICAKRRWHEHVEGLTLCIACLEKTEEVLPELTKDEATELIEEIAPNFNITKFIKENS